MNLITLSYRFLAVVTVAGLCLFPHWSQGALTFTSTAVQMSGSTSGTVTIQPAATAGTWTLTWPTNNGDNGQVLTTDGSGVTSWTTIAGGGITNSAEEGVIPLSDGTNLVASRITDDGEAIAIYNDSPNGETIIGSDGVGPFIQMANSVDPDGNYIDIDAQGGAIDVGTASKSEVKIDAVSRILALNTSDGSIFTNININGTDKTIGLTASPTLGTISLSAKAINVTGGFKLVPVTFANLPASPAEGMMAAITDSSTNTWGATITGGGANHVLGYYNGSNWTVMGK